MGFNKIMLGSFIRYLSDAKIRDKHKKMSEEELKCKYGGLVVPLVQEAIELYKPMKELLGDIILDEGVLDWAKEKLGVHKADSVKISDEQLKKVPRSILHTFVTGTPSMSDRVNYFVDVVLPTIEGENGIIGMKLKNLLRNANKLKKQNNLDKAKALYFELVTIIKDAHAIASKLDKPEYGVKRINDDIIKISKKLSEDINTNNGMILN